jgi:hypothetical protein
LPYAFPPFFKKNQLFILEIIKIKPDRLTMTRGKSLKEKPVESLPRSGQAETREQSESDLKGGIAKMDSDLNEKKLADPNELITTTNAKDPDEKETEDKVNQARDSNDATGTILLQSHETMPVRI